MVDGIHLAMQPVSRSRYPSTAYPGWHATRIIFGIQNVVNHKLCVSEAQRLPNSFSVFPSQFPYESEGGVSMIYPSWICLFDTNSHEWPDDVGSN